MSGTITHWWRQRVSSVLLIPLCLWLLWAGASVTGLDHPSALAFMSQPLNAVAALLLALIGLYHAQSGILVIVEDYIPGKAFPTFLILLTRVGCGLGVVAVIGMAYTLLSGA